jgi:prephenate dehydratase
VVKKQKVFDIFIKRRLKMGKVIAKNVVKRKTGYLYYVDGKGNVCEAKMARGGKKKKKKVVKKKPVSKKKKR